MEFETKKKQAAKAIEVDPDPSLKRGSTSVNSASISTVRGKAWRGGAGGGAVGSPVLEKLEERF